MTDVLIILGIIIYEFKHAAVLWECFTLKIFLFSF